ncbi:MAG: hypothetical protein ACAI43_16770 [Phycisphaerae bacterium]
MTAPDSPTPEVINGLRVVETGAFASPRWPAGYVPPPDGGPPLAPVTNVALCEADGYDGFYTFFCTQEWEVVTYEFDETREAARRGVAREFGADVTEWRARP